MSYRISPRYVYSSLPRRVYSSLPRHVYSSLSLHVYSSLLGHVYSSSLDMFYSGGVEDRLGVCSCLAQRFPELLASYQICECLGQHSGNGEDRSC
jgi:hypothetical protein